jgi:hypothetical protein
MIGHLHAATTADVTMGSLDMRTWLLNRALGINIFRTPSSMVTARKMRSTCGS